MENEIWKDLSEYTGIYMVSNFGRVKSLDRVLSNGTFKKGIILKTPIDKDGYPIVTLYYKGKHQTKTVHRLIANTFIKNIENLPQINHIDENKENNRVDNLEWCDVAYNINYGTRTKRAVDNTDYTTRNLDYKKIVEHTDYKKRSELIDYKAIAKKNSKPVYGIRLGEDNRPENRHYFPSILKASEYINGKPQSISRVISGKRRSTRGWVFFYSN